MARGVERGAVTLLGLLLSMSVAAAPACDPGLPSQASDALGYRAREARCEGRYMREVSGSALVVAGFGEPLPAWGPAPSGVAELRWVGASQAGEVKLVAQSLRRRVYYRMDAQRPAAPARFAWPRELAAALVPGAGDLGVLASQNGAGPARELLLPVRLGTQASDRYELVLLPGSEWRELRYSLTAARDDGATGAVLVRDQALQLGYYPAGRAVRLAIPKSLLNRASLYRIDLEAQLDDSGTVVRSLWFAHSPAW
jgi:hypothetical protein